MQSSNEILIIEDDRELAELLDSRLTREGFAVRKAHDGAEGYASAVSELPSLILLDLMLPGMRGMDVCKKLREKEATKSVPIIMLTANSDEVDVVLGLEVGADDYVTKPFNLRQLMARIRAVLRRASNEPSETYSDFYELGPIRINNGAHEVTVNQKPIPLTEAEYRLLLTLISRGNQVVTRAELLKSISEGDAALVERNIDVHIGSIRKKLGTAAKLIVTVRSLGYRCITEDQIPI